MAKIESKTLLAEAKSILKNQDGTARNWQAQPFSAATAASLAVRSVMAHFGMKAELGEEFAKDRKEIRDELTVLFTAPINFYRTYMVETFPAECPKIEKGKEYAEGC